MHWVIKEQMNKLNANHYRDLTPLQIDQAINNAQDLLLEDVLNDSRSFERVTQGTNIVDTLYEKAIAVPLTLFDAQLNHDVYVGSLDENYYYPLRAYVKCDCGLMNLSYTQHQDLNYKLNNSFHKPSCRWKRGLYNYGKGNVYVYVEKNSNPVELYVEYVRYPQRVFVGGYDTQEYVVCINSGGLNCNQHYKSTDTPVECEINSQYHNLVCDYAVRELSRNLENTPKTQLLQDKILTTLN